MVTHSFLAGLSIRKRPFSVEPITGIMLPDGIFDASIPTQNIVCFLTNQFDQPIPSLRVRIKSIGDPNVEWNQQILSIDGIAPGASVRLEWQASFTNAAVGKTPVTVQVGFWHPALIFMPSWVHEIETQIFVTRTTYDRVKKTYRCQVPEGTLDARFVSIVGPDNLQKWRDPEFRVKHPFLGPVVVREMELRVTPARHYAGVHGALPFQDPWWKVVAAVVAVIALIAAVIAAAMGYGTAYIGMKGEDFVDLETGDRPACYNCELDTWGGEEQFTAAGVLSIIAMLALAVAMMDQMDPWQRGQAATAPAPGEKTEAEQVNLSVKYPALLEAGKPYKLNTAWSYKRVTDRNAYFHRVEEETENEHVTTEAEVWTSSRSESLKMSIAVYARFTRPDKSQYSGDQLHVFALAISPTGRSCRFILQDDGVDADETHNDGIFSGRLDLHELGRAWDVSVDELRGRWEFYVFAQDINDAAPEMEPIEAARHIGGFLVHSPLKISIDGSKPCPNSADASIVVE